VSEEPDHRHDGADFEHPHGDSFTIAAPAYTQLVKQELGAVERSTHEDSDFKGFGFPLEEKKPLNRSNWG
jgi:hypothetical protein